MDTSSEALPRPRKFRASSVRVELLLGGFAPYIRPGNRVLDLGCGNGEIGHAVERRFGAAIVSADIENHLAYPFAFHRVTGNLDFQNEEFDFVMLNDVLHHIPKEQQLNTLREAARVARTVLIFDTAPTLTAKALDLVMNYVVYAGREPVPLAHRSAADWLNLLKKESFSADVAPLDGPFYYPLRHFVIVVRKP